MAELKIEFNEAALQEASLRASILKGTVDHLLSVLTPEALRVFVEKLLADTLKGISSYEIQCAMRPHCQAIIQEYVERPGVKAHMEEVLHASVDSYVDEFPAMITSTIMETARKAFMESLTNKLRYG
jgi:hypothetical protein